MNYSKNKVRRIVVGWGIVVAAIILYAMINMLPKIGKIAVDVKIAPYETSVFIDGAKVDNNSVVYLSPEEHVVFAFLEGFGTYEGQITVSKNSHEVVLQLTPTTSMGAEKANAVRDDFLDVERYVGSQYQEDQSADNDPIFSILPYTVENYGIGTKLENGNLMVTMTLHDVNYTDIAVEKLLSLTKKAGISISGYNFIINDFTNDFEKTSPNSNLDFREYLSSECSKLGFRRYLIASEQYQDGYLYTLITITTSRGVSRTYRIIMEQDSNGFWQFATTPYPILTKANSPNAPIDIINLVNDIHNAQTANSGE